MADEFMAYCVKEKAQKPMNDAHEVILKNGKHAMQGVCSSCGTKMMKFISSKKATPTETPAPVAGSGSEPASAAPVAGSGSEPTPTPPPTQPPAPSA